MSDIKLHGRVFITMLVETKTGLHIGGSTSGMEIGGIDNAIIRDPLTQYPYIPGSSLRGKMRSQLEKLLGLPQNNPVGQVKIHTCKNPDTYEHSRFGGKCPVCRIFGVPGEDKVAGQTLLLVRDARLTEASAKQLNAAHTDFAYSELKTEVTIDRVTSAATPRQIERVPAGSEFGPVELVFNIFEKADINLLKYVIDGLQLIEDDYLGGYGSRGSGKVAFKNIEIKVRSSVNYADLTPFQTSSNLASLLAAYPALNQWVIKSIPVE